MIVAIPLLVLVPRDQPALPPLRAAPARRRRCGGRRCAARVQHDVAARRVDRRGGRRGIAVRARDLARPAPSRAARAGARNRSGNPAALVRLRTGGADARVLVATGPVDAVLEEVWRLPRGESDFVTVVVPELFTAVAPRAGATAPSSSRSSCGCSPSRVSSSPTSRCVAGAAGGHAERLVVRVLVSGVNGAVDARGQLRADLGIEDTRGVTSPSRRGGARDPRRLAAGGGRHPARRRRGALPRPRHAAPRLPPRAHRRRRTRSST